MWLENILCIILLFEKLLRLVWCAWNTGALEKNVYLLLLDGGFCELVRSFWFKLFTISLSLGSVVQVLYLLSKGECWSLQLLLLNCLFLLLILSVYASSCYFGVLSLAFIYLQLLYHLDRLAFHHYMVSFVSHNSFCLWVRFFLTFVWPLQLTFGYCLHGMSFFHLFVFLFCCHLFV